jgi:GTP-binding protein HflX
MFKVVLTGYTNTGKSTLLNRLCGSGVLAEDRLFATLDSTRRRLDPGGGGAVVVSDTVGFIERLPENLVASFRSTLAVVREADLVVLVGDLSDPWREGQMTAVRSTLDSIGAGGIPRILVWNKRDMVPDAPAPMDGLAVSALTGEGIPALVERIRRARDGSLEWFELTLPPESGPEENWIRENCSIRSRHSGQDGIRIVAGCARGVDLIRSYMAERPEGWTITPLDQPAEDASPESGRDG